jgi:hypothetical protein
VTPTYLALPGALIGDTIDLARDLHDPAITDEAWAYRYACVMTTAEQLSPVAQELFKKAMVEIIGWTFDAR